MLVQIVDFVDAGHPALRRMREKHQRLPRVMPVSIRFRCSIMYISPASQAVGTVSTGEVAVANSHEFLALLDHEAELNLIAFR